MLSMLRAAQQARIRFLNRTETFAETYTFVDVDFGAGFTEDIRGPVGRVGQIVAIALYNVTEVFNSVTLAARVDIGSAGDPNQYVISEDVDDLATGAAQSPDFSDGVIGNHIPSDEDVRITGVAPTGGTPTGISSLSVTIAWS